jgi:hypothetical protein
MAWKFPATFPDISIVRAEEKTLPRTSPRRMNRSARSTMRSPSTVPSTRTVSALMIIVCSTVSPALTSTSSSWKCRSSAELGAGPATSAKSASPSASVPLKRRETTERMKSSSMETLARPADAATSPNSPGTSSRIKKRKSNAISYTPCRRKGLSHPMPDGSRDSKIQPRTPRATTPSATIGTRPNASSRGGGAARGARRNDCRARSWSASASRLASS